MCCSACGLLRGPQLPSSNARWTSITMRVGVGMRSTYGSRRRRCEPAARGCRSRYGILSLGGFTGGGTGAGSVAFGGLGFGLGGVASRRAWRPARLGLRRLGPARRASSASRARQAWRGPWLGSVRAGDLLGRCRVRRRDLLRRHLPRLGRLWLAAGGRRAPRRPSQRAGPGWIPLLARRRPVAERGAQPDGSDGAAACTRFGVVRGAAAAGLTTGGGGVATLMASAAAPAAPAPTPGETLPSQAKRRCGAAAAKADQTTARRPR